MRLTIVTDAWAPQVNGVVTTLTRTVRGLQALGVDVEVITPQGFASIPCPSYPEIRLAIFPGAEVQRRLLANDPDAVHIATEGPLGMAARRCCLDQGWQFSTSYHTRFPEYLSARWPLPEEWTYAWLRRFHGAAARTMVGTPSMRRELTARGFKHLVEWTRGVDSELFQPKVPQRQLPWGRERTERPVLMYVGRVAVEKNIAAFLDLPYAADKVVVGDGPALAALRQAHPAVVWTGFLAGENLAGAVAQADCVVFPSRTDTFGLVMLEAMACGVPVAAFPVTGPCDVVTPGVTGELHEDLAMAVRGALRLDRHGVAAAVAGRQWSAATAQFLGHLAPTREARVARMLGAIHSRRFHGQVQ